MKPTIAKTDWHQKPNKRERIIFLVAILVFLFGFVKVFWIPSRAAISIAKKDLEEVVNEKMMLEAALSQEAMSGIKLKEHPSVWAKDVVESPPSVLMREFSNPAILKGVRLINVEFKNVATNAGTIQQGWKISLNGPFESMGRYLERLENLHLILIIDSLNINGSASGIGHVNAEVEGSVYGWK